jgi:hypothetical protein
MSTDRSIELTDQELSQVVGAVAALTGIPHASNISDGSGTGSGSGGGGNGSGSGSGSGGGKATTIFW